MNPVDKRLAMLVEDHPYDYKDFEGIIPVGNYGAGTVIVWDQGYYEPIDKVKDKKEQEKLLTNQFYEGGLAIRLHGKKIRGDFGLVKMKEKGENAWLLIKLKDKFVLKTDITKKADSVISGKTIEEMSADKTAKKWRSNRNSSGKVKEERPKGEKAVMPDRVSPMLCTLTKEPVSDDEYIYEIKWDGYRIVSFVDGKKVKMHSRSGLDYTAKYPPIAKALKQSGHKMVVDGEVVVLNQQGLPDFDALQLYNGHNTPVTYYIFDILWLDGYDLKSLPLTERKDILISLIGDHDILNQ